MIVALSEITYGAVTAIGTAILALATGAFVVAAFRQLGPLKDTQRASEEAARAAARAADAAEQSVTLAHQAQEQHSMLSTYPQLTCSGTLADDDANIAIANTGTMPAHDVEVIVLQILWEEDLSPEEYLRRYAKDPNQTAPATVEEGGYAVRDVLRYFVVAPQRVVSARLDFPTVGHQLVILIQFRDILERNYAHIYRLGLWTLTEGRYRRQEGSTSGLLPSNRLEFFSLKSSASRIIPTDSPITRDLEEFATFWDASIPTGTLVTSDADWDDRGTWSAL